MAAAATVVLAVASGAAHTGTVATDEVSAVMAMGEAIPDTAEVMVTGVATTAMDEAISVTVATTAVFPDGAITPVIFLTATGTTTTQGVTGLIPSDSVISLE